MRFYARFVAICNICFLLYVVLRHIELGMHQKGNMNNLIPLPFLEGSIVLLGYLVAILANAAFVFIVLYRKSIRKHVNVSKAIIWFNIILLPIEIWYIFLSPPNI